ncbi:hypothetical protein J3R30DRAFT_865886 [Lentinula aciculospora]|uniref:Uncharacterized protein n=1 Tax=Lentinula aciculospora TaxID=153920 RepID=A0A9W9AQ31_9AGAR|nr:hypothetical protein J3R30DRAFT_865886 [Lentinula aciculospora]
MGQYWIIINIDKRETTGHLGKLAECFWYSTSVVKYLKTPIVPSCYQPNASISEEKLMKFKGGHNLAAVLLTLPTELLAAIAEELLEEYFDLICLSLTCSTMWEVTGRTRYRSLCSLLKRRSWAGDRVMLIGDYTNTLPKGVFTAQDRKYLALSTRSRYEQDLYEHACAKYQNPKTKSQCLSLLKDERVQNNSALRRDLMQFAYKKPFSRWILLEEEFTPVIQNSKTGSPEDHWMVRSLDRQEYVTNFSARNLAQVLYCLIGCSDDPSGCVAGGDALIEGAWAGDRIDITLASTHKQEYGEALDWKDITVNIKTLLEEIATEEEREDFEF